MRSLLHPENRRRCWGLATILVYCGLAVWSTWPLAASATSRLPLGPGNFTTVPLFNLWTIWWNADRVSHGLADYWDAPIFAPTESTFAFSEPQPITILLAPIIWISGSRVLAYNTYLGLSLVLNGVMAYRLLRFVAVGRLAALAGGAALLLLPITHWQRDVLQLIPLWGILWTWTAFLQLSRRPGVAAGLQVGFAFAATFFCSIHHALFSAIVMSGAVWTSVDRFGTRQFWKGAITALIVAGGLTAPMIVHLRSVTARHEFTRPVEMAERFSARPGDYTAAYGEPLIDFGTLAARPAWRTGAGWIRYGLAAAGIACGLYRRKWRRATLFLSTITALAFVLSLGPHLTLGRWQPWQTLSQTVPGVAQVRSVFRFAYFVQMAVVLLAALGVYGLWLWQRAAWRHTRWKRVSPAVALVLCALLAFEIRPSPVVLTAVPTIDKHADWIAFVRQHVAADRTLVCLPFAPGNLTQDFEVSVRWMYLGTFHGVPLVNGYSGFFPESYFEIREQVKERFPDADVLERLREVHGAEYIVVDQRAYPDTVLSELKESRRDLEHALTSSSGIDVFRLRSSRD